MPSSRATIPRLKSIKIKEHLDTLAESNAVSIDIGGTLAKVIIMDNFIENFRCFEEPVLTPHQHIYSPELSIFLPGIRANLHFFCFETNYIYECGSFIASNWNKLHPSKEKFSFYDQKLRATGGGSFKHKELFKKLDLDLCCRDEMFCTVVGMNFLIAYVDHEFYTYKDLKCVKKIRKNKIKPILPRVTHFPKHFPLENIDLIFPYLLVNIGSGVSIVKVTGRTSFQRVSGSSLGGGTFWGLCKLLTNCKSFGEVIELSKKGDNSKVDMLVKDIYGGDYSSIGLSENVIAASFGKLTMNKEKKGVILDFLFYTYNSLYFLFWTFVNIIFSMPLLGFFLKKNKFIKNLTVENLHSSYFNNHFKARDVTLSALRTISYNIGQIGFLNAKRFGLREIYFGGNFIRKHPYTIASISYAVKFWSNDKIGAFFSLHDGYLGALGAFLDGKNYFSN